MSSGSQTVVLGAGVSGLAAARELQVMGFTPSVIEACPSVGGLTRTVHVDEFCFDYTGHFLHLAQHGTPAALPHAGLNDMDWRRVERRAFAYLDGKLVPAPVQYHIGQLPDPLRGQCVQAYEDRPKLPEHGEASFQDWVVSGFGETLADRFLIPQNEKTMAVSLRTLSRSAVRRFFPAPDDALVRRGMSSVGETVSTYNSQFWYPKTGGIDLLVAGLARGVANVDLLERVVEIDLEQRRIRSASGRTWSWDRLLSSIPLKVLCELTRDAELCSVAAGLSHSATISFGIGLRGPLPGLLNDAHWIYVPDRAIPFYRMGIYSNIGPGFCLPGMAALYVEVGLPAEDLGTLDIAGDLQPRVMAALDDLGWVRSDQVVCSVTHVIKCAYVHHTHDAESLIERAMSRLASRSVFLIGRYGRWDYISIEDSILSGVTGARRAVLS